VVVGQARRMLSRTPLPAAACCCVSPDADKANAVLPIGGPGKALSAKEQADILFRCAGGWQGSRAEAEAARRAAEGHPAAKLISGSLFLQCLHAV
jgi:hypothetical protein